MLASTHKAVERNCLCELRLECIALRLGIIAANQQVRILAFQPLHVANKPSISVYLIQ